jgi:hypothetical protein
MATILVAFNVNGVVALMNVLVDVAINIPLVVTHIDI